MLFTGHFGILLECELENTSMVSKDDANKCNLPDLRPLVEATDFRMEDNSIIQCSRGYKGMVENNTNFCTMRKSTTQRAMEKWSDFERPFSLSPFFFASRPTD